jgi:DNA-directed RNA polymerase subunit E'/Rpb7
MTTPSEHDIFITSVLYEKIKLPAHELHSAYKSKITSILKDKLSGKCTKHGLIKIGSIEVLKISLGNVEVQTFKGSANFIVKFRADVCNPLVGTVVLAKVQHLNSFGILCTCSYDYTDDDNNKHQHVVLEVIVPKQSMAVQSEVPINTLKPGQSVNIEVMGKKFQLNDIKISVIGRVVKTIRGVYHEDEAQSNIIDVDADVDADVDIDLDVDVDDDDENEEEEENSDVDADPEVNVKGDDDDAEIPADRAAQDLAESGSADDAMSELSADDIDDAEEFEYEDE